MGAVCRSQASKDECLRWGFWSVLLLKTLMIFHNDKMLFLRSVWPFHRRPAIAISHLKHNCVITPHGACVDSPANSLVALCYTIILAFIIPSQAQVKTRHLENDFHMVK